MPRWLETSRALQFLSIFHISSWIFHSHSFPVVLLCRIHHSSLPSLIFHTNFVIETLVAPGILRSFVLHICYRTLFSSIISSLFTNFWLNHLKIILLDFIEHGGCLPICCTSVATYSSFSLLTIQNEYSCLKKNKKD